MHDSLWHKGHGNCHIWTCVCGSVLSVPACTYTARVHMTSCSLHSVKSTETRGVKLFPTKTSSDAGMVDCVSDATGSCMEKTTGKKGQEQGVVFRNVTTCQHWPAWRHILWIRFHHPYIWQHFDGARPVHQSAFMASKFTEICWTTHKFYNLSTNSCTEDLNSSNVVGLSFKSTCQVEHSHELTGIVKKIL